MIFTSPAGGSDTPVQLFAVPDRAKQGRVKQDRVKHERLLRRARFAQDTLDPASGRRASPTEYFQTKTDSRALGNACAPWCRSGRTRAESVRCWS